jgi:hypothetical protein
MHPAAIRTRNRARLAMLDADAPARQVLYDKREMREACEDVAALLELVEELLERTREMKEAHAE